MVSERIPVEVDVVIVGSGPAGCAAARSIADTAPDLSVVIIERGPHLTDPWGVSTRNLSGAERGPLMVELAQEQAAMIGTFVATYGEPLVRPRPGTKIVRLSPTNGDAQVDMPGALYAENVGGMGVFWTCASPRPRGSERISFIDGDDLDEAFDAAEALLGVRTDAYPDDAVATRLRENLSARFDSTTSRIQPMPLAARPSGAAPEWAGVRTILGPLAAAVDTGRGIRLISETIVTAIRQVDDGGVRVEVVERSGDRRTVGARSVVVAADALRTPQLLWASGIRPPALGRFLNDQPQVVAAAYFDAAERPSAAEAAASGSSPVMDAEMDHPFHGTPGGGQDSVVGVSWLPFDDSAGRPVHVQVMQMDASPIQIGDQRTSDERPVVGVGVFAAKDLQWSDRVWFTDEETDDVGLPVIHIDYGLTAIDRARLDFAVDVATSVSTAVGGFTPGGEPVILPAGSSIHYQGTVRMGQSDDGLSVCDSWGRVWGTRSVWVAGNGVIPTETACNPTLTNVALAWRTGRRLAEELRGADRALTHDE
ncbi:FAD-dependent oxidoreductase [Microbacterium aoyamense]|uniref:FAD-dependent oxidoreductase n=1 Tax=Microbacterium aoyamense TaxID=344166 RepID=UPI002003F9DA|nr:FAD-dependent oxidoreductase [Microbacterium aoyamense]